MSVLLQTAVAHLGKAEHPLDDPDDMLDPGAHFGVGAVFRSLDVIHDAAVAVAAIGEIPRLGRMFPDYPTLAAVGLIAPHPGLLPVQQLGQYRAVGDIGRRRAGLSAVTSSANAAAYTFTTIDVPIENSGRGMNAPSPSASGINNEGQIVGTFNDAVGSH